MREKIVLIGSGSIAFTKGLVADMLRAGWEIDLALVDIDAEALAASEGLARKMIAARKAPVRLSATSDRREALPGATAVICTIAVGSRRGREIDVHLPRNYGLFYPVGDSVGPGGTARCLRQIPPMVAIAHDVMDLAPDALFWNYSNPMAPICRAVRKATGANLTGLCHGSFSIAGRLADLLGVERDCMRYSCVGINHLSFFTEMTVDGQSVFPRLHELGRKKLADGLTEIGREGYDEPLTWRLFELLDAFPYPGDRHLMEFLPHFFAREKACWGKTLGVDTLDFDALLKRQSASFEKMKEDALSDEPLTEDFFKKIGGEHEQVIDIIDSIRSDARRVFVANLPNRGQIPNLPAEAIVECNAIADSGGLKPILQSPVSPAVAGLLAQRFQWVETVVDAALEGSRQKFIQALVLDGAVDSIEMAARMADDFLSEYADVLPQFHIEKTATGQSSSPITEA